MKAKKIFIVGETGAGKSTLVNSTLNYYLDVQMRDPFRYKLIFEDKDKAKD